MSETLEVTVKVAKEAHELGEGITAFVRTVRQALADGWQPGQDLPVILISSVADLIPGFDGADKIREERESDPEAFAAAVALFASTLFAEVTATE